jgi:putative ABC transport system permease protein
MILYLPGLHRVGEHCAVSKYLPLVWAGLWRRPVRSALTVLSITIAFLLVGLLQGVNAAFTETIAAARRDLMIVNIRVRGSPPMPLAMRSTIANVPGVVEVVPRAYFIGTYRPPYDIAALATEPEGFFRLRPALAVDKSASLEAMRTVRSGMLATPALLAQYDWQVGNRITLRSRELKIDGSADWTFDIVGTFDSVQNPNTATLAVINYAYFDDYRVANRGTAELFYIRIADATRSIATAAAIDRTFANSPHATRTRSDQDRAEADAAQMGDIAFFTNAILGAVLFTLFFVTANTMRQSVQDRIGEFGVLKALGYSDAKVFALALAEALTLYAVGAWLGLMVAAAVAPLADDIARGINVSWTVAVRAVVAAGALALISVALPSLRLYRLTAARALASH